MMIMYAINIASHVKLLVFSMQNARLNAVFVNPNAANVQILIQALILLRIKIAKKTQMVLAVLPSASMVPGRIISANMPEGLMYPAIRSVLHQILIAAMKQKWILFVANAQIQKISIFVLIQGVTFMDTLPLI